MDSARVAPRGGEGAAAVKCLTQTCLDPGNCLQTVIACITGAEIAEVPTQLEDVGAYLSVLDDFFAPRRLRLEIAGPGESLEDYRLAYLEHVMVGRMRSTFAGSCEEHCVVGRRGRQVWDPYPTRPGLTRIDWLGLLVIR
jgi:hypothetical protein